MNSWEIIKQKAAGRSRVGSAGYQVELNHAATLFVAIAPLLKDRKKAEATFNSDIEVTKALINATKLKEIGLLNENS